MNNQQSNGNIELDASIAMISQGGSGGWSGTSGNNINTVTLVGGRIANIAKACYCNSRNLYFDQRFAGGSFLAAVVPVHYPSTGSNVVDPLHSHNRANRVGRSRTTRCAWKSLGSLDFSRVRLPRARCGNRDG